MIIFFINNQILLFILKRRYEIKKENKSPKRKRKGKAYKNGTKK
jgi:hypothetical protein